MNAPVVDPLGDGVDGVPQLVAALEAHRADVVRHFAGLGFDAGVARDTLADVPRKVAAYGDGIELDWLLGIVRADVVALGRLQFERLPQEGRHAVHVPEGGPLTDAAVEDSLSRAAAVLGARRFSCRSWLLDPLLEALGPGSGIVRFARRFSVGDVVRDEEADRAVAKFVFRRSPEEVLRAAAPRTRLERLVAAHLRSGGHWSQPRGTLSRPA